MSNYFYIKLIFILHMAISLAIK